MLKGEDEASGKILAAAIEVHRELGPGLLESAYEECLCRELCSSGIHFERQKEIPVVYKGEPVSASYRADLVVEGKVIVELKAVDAVLKVHEAQILTYMRMASCPVGLLINVNVSVLKDGVRRFLI